MEKMKCSEIARACAGISKGEDVEVTGITTDTRDIHPGDLFIALRGDKFDGHCFIGTALEKGAAAVMCEHDAGIGSAHVIIVGDTRQALLALASHIRRKYEIPLVAVTGSVGKTTTKDMTALVLSAGYKTLKTQGNLNNDIGVPQTLFGLDRSYRAAVVEMGMNHLGEISRLSRCAQPTLGIITNIGVSHIENLGSRENILKAKLELLNGLCEYAPLLLNGDDELLAGAVIEKHPVFYFGIENPKNRVRAEEIEQTDRGLRFTICFGDTRTPVELPCVGRHNIYNALAAFAAGVIFGIAPKDAGRALAGYIPSGMRQRVREMGGVSFIEDCYNANPDSMRAAIDTLCDIKSKRRIAVLGSMLELGRISPKAHHEVGAYTAARGIDILYTYSANGVYAAGAEMIDRGAADNGLTDRRSFDDAAALAGDLCRTLHAGDAVLFKASRGVKMEDALNALYEEWKENE
ncbi:MAG TPA: UDP-N-acetylmuramoyl-tripeptide--D-alanyl-D-alanine ligase [Candidatus Onthovicinus excrementipullorum]|nr:UDP-N-acetylmuramoyl-tripeptide--D-alanyl-D-alanine ligase [Candidatus Onthovicinus excrementipullorum]